MGDDDLIRRGDALKCCRTQRRGSAAAYDIRAIPAVSNDAIRAGGFAAGWAAAIEAAAVRAETARAAEIEEGRA